MWLAITGIFLWFLERMTGVVSWVIRQVFTPIFKAIERLVNTFVVSSIIPFAEQLLEYVFIGVFITPLFLINQVSDAIDIFAGVKPVYDLDRADAAAIEAVYDTSPHYLLWRDEYGRTPPWPVSQFAQTPTQIAHAENVERLELFFSWFWQYCDHGNLSRAHAAALAAMQNSDLSEFNDWKTLAAMKKAADYLDLESMDTREPQGWEGNKWRRYAYDFFDEDERFWVSGNISYYSIYFDPLTGIRYIELCLNDDYIKYLDNKSLAKNLGLTLEQIAEWQTEIAQLNLLEFGTGKTSWNESAELPELKDLENLGRLILTARGYNSDRWIGQGGYVRNLPYEGIPGSGAGAPVSITGITDYLDGIGNLRLAVTGYLSLREEYELNIPYGKYLDLVDDLYTQINKLAPRYEKLTRKIYTLEEALKYMADYSATGANGEYETILRLADAATQEPRIRLSIPDCEAVINEESNLVTMAAEDIRELWRGFIQNNDTIVLRQTRNYTDETRYMPYVRQFMADNNIIPGSDNMYYVLSNALCTGSPVGVNSAGLGGNEIAAVTADYINSIAPKQISAEAMIYTAAMPKSLSQPFFEYTNPRDDNAYYLMFEWFVESKDVYWDDAFELKDEDGKNIPPDRNQMTKKQKKTLTKLNKKNRNAYLTLFAKTIGYGYADPDYVADRLEYLRENPIIYRYDTISSPVPKLVAEYTEIELDSLHNASLMIRGGMDVIRKDSSGNPIPGVYDLYEEGGIGDYMMQGPWALANEIALESVYTKKKNEAISSLSPQNPNRLDYYNTRTEISIIGNKNIVNTYFTNEDKLLFDAIAGEFPAGFNAGNILSGSPKYSETFFYFPEATPQSPSFFMTYGIPITRIDPEAEGNIKSWKGFEGSSLTIACFYPANILWEDFIQNNYDIVIDHTKAYDDVLRYTPATLRFLTEKGILTDWVEACWGDFIKIWEEYVRTDESMAFIDEDFFFDTSDASHYSPEALDFMERLGFFDLSRYPESSLAAMKSRGYFSSVGSEEMYKIISNGIMNYDFLVWEDGEEIPVRGIPVNRWISRDLGYTPYRGVIDNAADTAMTLDAGIKGTLLGYFFENDTVNTIFWGITLISMALCVGFSIYAVTRSMGDLEVKKPVSKVIGMAGKAMLTFLVIPLFVISALSLTSVVLTQTTSLIAGSGGSNVTISGALFTSAVVPEAVLVPPEKSTLSSYVVDRNGKIAHSKLFYNTASDNMRNNRYQQLMKEYGAKRIDFSDMANIRRDFDIVKLIWPGNLLAISICAWIFIIILIMVMFIFIRRIFDIVMLYIISPFFTATIPLDDGMVFKNWRERFIGQCISGFGSLVVIQIFFLMLPFIWSPDFVLMPNIAGNTFLKALLMIGGVLTVYKSHTMITVLVSPEAGERDSGPLKFIAGAAKTAIAGAEFAGATAKQAFASDGRSSGNKSSSNKNKNDTGRDKDPGDSNSNKKARDTNSTKDIVPGNDKEGD